MKNKQPVAATTADLRATLTVDFGKTIQKGVIIFIGGKDSSVSFSEREMIAENAWFHVLENSEKYDASKGASFKTWAIKVAENFAKDELRKLRRSPFYLVGSLERGCLQRDDSREELVQYIPIEANEGSERWQYWHEAYETFKSIMSGYSGRDRKVVEMLICERTKEEIMTAMQMSGIMTAMQMSGSAVDTCLCRLRKKMLADMRRAGFNLAA